MSKNIAVIGGGIVGLCSAYYLVKEGHEVTIFDASNMDAGASYVNAGYLCPSHIIPLAAPGVVKKGIKWMFDASSPLYIKPRLEADFLKWAWAFNKSCNPKHVKKAIPVIKDIAVLSQELYEDFKHQEKFNFHFEKKGLFMLCKTQKALDGEHHIADLAKKEGLAVEMLTADEVKSIDPNANIDCIGAAYYTCDWHTTPHEFMEEIKQELSALGVNIHKNEGVSDFNIQEGQIKSVVTSKSTYDFDEVVMAAGSWTPLLAKKMGIKLLVQAGKGYRINSYKNYNITVPAILTETKIAVTPMNGFTRIAGTMEIAGINQDINKIRVEAIAKGVKQYYPDVLISQDEKEEVACGLRPVSPDGLPYIGRSKKCKNLTIAAGHAMMGWTMATGTGKLVQELIDNKKSSLKMTAFNPDRKF